MKLDNKKELAARTLSVGKGRLIFNKERLEEIKEIITRQDVRDMVREKVIIVGEIKGRKKIVKRKTRRRMGSIKKKVSRRKADYIILVRKLRGFVLELKKKEVITREEYRLLRKEIKANQFKNKAQLKERLTHIIKERE